MLIAVFVVLSNLFAGGVMTNQSMCISVSEFVTFKKSLLLGGMGTATGCDLYRLWVVVRVEKSV